MIRDTFMGYKFQRTYIGGTAQTEEESFVKIKGLKEDLSDSNLVEFRRLLIYYYNDVVHVLLSWKKITLILGFSLLGLSVFFIENPIIFLSFFLLSFFSIIIHYYLNHKIKQNHNSSYLAMALITPLIKKYTGLDLN